MSERVTLTVEEAVGWLEAVREACLAEFCTRGTSRHEAYLLDWVASDVREAKSVAAYNDDALRLGYAASKRRKGQDLTARSGLNARFAGRAYLTIAAILEAVKS